MANSYCQLYVQAVFAVKYRRAVLEKPWRSEVFAVMGNLINETGCQNIIVNGVEDHVHLFFQLSKNVCIADVMKVVKAKSSKFINENNFLNHRFEWQKGYGVFTYNKSLRDRVFHYVRRQEIHHQKQKFLKEYKEILEKFEVEYDPKYSFEEMV